MIKENRWIWFLVGISAGTFILFVVTTIKIKNVESKVEGLSAPRNTNPDIYIDGRLSCEGPWAAEEEIGLEYRTRYVLTLGVGEPDYYLGRYVKADMNLISKDFLEAKDIEPFVEQKLKELGKKREDIYKYDLDVVKEKRKTFKWVEDK